jgi:hypothetical protein
MVLTLFAACYQPVVTALGATDWQRTALPQAGGVGDQDAWLLDAFEYVRRIQIELARDRARAARPPSRPKPTKARKAPARER